MPLQENPVLTTTLSQFGADLDPAVRQFIRETGEAYVRHGSTAATTQVEARAIAEKVRAPWVAGGPVMARTEMHRVVTPHGDVGIRLYDPAPGAAKPCLVYIHGGGFVMFSLDTHDRIMREYAARAGICVIGIDYSLSPEVRFPVALEEIVAVVRHIRDHAADFGVDGARLAMGGDSAGANLSVAAALVLRDTGDGDLIKALVLNYGAFAIELHAEDKDRFGGDGYMLTTEEMGYFWRQYLGRPEDAENPLAVPLKADLRGLPPAFLAIPQCDVLTGQSHDMQARLTAAGVRARAVAYAGASHSFLEAVSISDLAGRAFDDTAQWLRAELGVSDAG